MKHVIALDVGGTGMKAALVGAGGELLHQARRPTGRERGSDAVVEGILGFAADLRAHGIRELGEPASAAGVAVPGIVDEAEGIAAFAANLGWRDVPLRALLTERLGGVPVALGHDVRTGGLAEGRIGAGRGADRFLFVPLGTGIAGAIGIDGRVEAGAHGFAGEIGHIVVRPGGAACPCGQRGCLERFASASAVSQAWAATCGDPDADAADCAKAVESGTPAPCGCGRTRWTRSPTAWSPRSPCWTPHADHRWRARRGGGNLVHTAAGGRPTAGHLPEAPVPGPRGSRGHRRMPGRGASRLGPDRDHRPLDRDH